MKYKNIYIYEVILFLFIILINISNKYLELEIILFSLISLFILYNVLGLPKNNTLLNRNAVQLSIIITMIYFLIYYLSGLYFGFLNNIYTSSFINIFINSFYLIVMIISEEYIRVMISNKCNSSKIPLVILTILYILLDVVLVFNTHNNLFIFICRALLPIIARNILCSYLSCYVSVFPSIIYRLLISIYIYIIPIIPDTNYYILGILNIIFPFILYKLISKSVNSDNAIKLINSKRIYLDIPLTFILIVVVILVSGIFKYQMISIGSGSMQPNINIGDAVIFKKISDGDIININDVIVFNHNGKYIVHRVIDIYYDNNKIVYQTKGDNNDSEDNFLVYDNDIVGIVRMKVKYIGMPSIWLSQLGG
jgi:signal peptidase I